jgi:DNA-binding NtrC family response regulator
MEQKIKLLIADDEPKFLESISKRLELRGFDVARAATGEEAVRAAENEKFDLALLDLKMPGMDGRETLEMLKKRHKYIEVIMLTGHGSIESAEECTRLGAFGYLPKPYEFDKLIGVLRNAYETRLVNKFGDDPERMDQMRKVTTGDEPLAILRELSKLDNEER